MGSFSRFAYDHGKFRAFMVVGFAAFLAAACLFALIATPLAALGVVSWGTVVGGSIGCGIGTAIPNSMFAAISA